MALQPAPKHIDVDEDEVVEGTKQNPDGDALLARKKARFGTLVKLREDFRRELLQSTLVAPLVLAGAAAIGHTGA